MYLYPLSPYLHIILYATAVQMNVAADCITNRWLKHAWVTLSAVPGSVSTSWRLCSVARKR